MNELLNQNLNYLMIKQKYIYQKINQYIESNHSYAELYFSNEDFPNLIIRSKDDAEMLFYDEEKVADKSWLNEHDRLKEGYRDVVMLGFGLSYHLVDLLQLNSNLRFFIYEPRVDIFIEALKVVDIKGVFEHPRVKMFDIGYENVHFENFTRHKNLNITNYFYHVVIPQYVSISGEEVKRFLNTDYSVTKNTLYKWSFDAHFQSLPYRNSIRNLEHVVSSQSLDVLNDKFEGCTALIVGAGPSLEVDIETIKAYKDKVFVIAAGSAIQSLLHYDIKPDLIVSIDPGKINNKVFENIDYSDIPLVFATQLYPYILDRKQKGLLYMTLSSESLNSVILDDVLSPTIQATPSVSGITIQIACILGASNVILVGQDASFPNNTYYSKGATHVDKNTLNNNINNASEEVRNVQGGINKTNRIMTLIREGNENMIRRYNKKGRRFYNASSLGAVTAGAEFKPLDAILAELELKVYDFSEINTIALKEETDENHVRKILDKLEEKVVVLDSLISECKKVGKALSDFEVASRKSFDVANNKLLKLEAIINRITNNEIYSKLVTAWATTLCRNYDKDVVKIDLEINMINKAKLLKEIVLPFTKELQPIYEDIKKELTQVTNKIKARENNEQSI